MREGLLTLTTVIIAVAVGIGVYIYIESPNSTVVQNNPPTTASATEVSFRELAHGAQSSEAKQTNYLITSPTELSLLWKMIDTSREVPKIDFTKSSVVAVFAGNRPTAGYEIRVTGVTDSDSRRVTITVTKPGISCLATKTITSPYQVIELPKTSLSLTHTDTESIVSCLN